MKLALPAFSAILLLAACSQDTAAREKKAEIAVADYDQHSTLDKDFILPQPVTLVEAFSAAGLVYQKGLANPPENKQKYRTKADQLLNIGTYSADLAYAILNNRTQESNEYMAAIQLLGSKAGLERVFSDKELLDKFEANLNNKEKLKDLLYELQENMDDYLGDNDLKHLASIQFAGAWTEAMYLACSQWKDKVGRDEKINTSVAEQMGLLENLVIGLRTSPAKDERIMAITAALEKLNKHYQNLESVRTTNANANFAVPQLTRAEFSAVFAELKAIRERIILAI